MESVEYRSQQQQLSPSPATARPDHATNTSNQMTTRLRTRSTSNNNGTASKATTVTLPDNIHDHERTSLHPLLWVAIVLPFVAALFYSVPGLTGRATVGDVTSSGKIGTTTAVGQPSGIIQQSLDSSKGNSPHNHHPLIPETSSPIDIEELSVMLESACLVRNIPGGQLPPVCRGFQPGSLQFDSGDSMSMTSKAGRAELDTATSSSPLPISSNFAATSKSSNTQNINNNSTKPINKNDNTVIWAMWKKGFWICLGIAAFITSWTYKLFLRPLGMVLNPFWITFVETPYGVVRDIAKTVFPVYAFFFMACVIGVGVGGIALWVAHMMIVAIGADRDRPSDTVAIRQRQQLRTSFHPTDRFSPKDKDAVGGGVGGYHSSVSSVRSSSDDDDDSDDGDGGGRWNRM